ncbi:MAG: RNA methyltransferase [Gloeobacteraceae cyanobacterium ES-bin-316]|nr:RNA methyltransferase [Ferruginibacter sp.]
MLSKASVKYIQSLQHKKFRDEEGVFVAEGPKLVRELLEGEIFACKFIYALPGWLAAESAMLQKIEPGLINPLQDFELDKISSLSKPNQLLALFEKKKVNTNVDVKNKITLVLDDIQDPGNLGTLIRIADWFGVENIICSRHTADMYNSKVVQSTMASLQRVNVYYTDIAAWLLANNNVPVFAATLQGESLQTIASLKEGIIIIGNEAAGIGDAVLKIAHHKITIPRFGQAESLNAAVAAGLILYEARREA